MAKQCTHVSGGYQEKGMRLLTSQRENLQAVSQEQGRSRVTLERLAVR